jgi:ABC-type sulfate transport system permease component
MIHDKNIIALVFVCISLLLLWMANRSIKYFVKEIKSESPQKGYELSLGSAMFVTAIAVEILFKAYAILRGF